MTHSFDWVVEFKWIWCTGTNSLDILPSCHISEEFTTYISRILQRQYLFKLQNRVNSSNATLDKCPIIFSNFFYENVQFSFNSPTHHILRCVLHLLAPTPVSQCSAVGNVFRFRRLHLASLRACFFGIFAASFCKQPPWQLAPCAIVHSHF